MLTTKTVGESPDKLPACHAFPAPVAVRHAFSILGHATRVLTYPGHDTRFFCTYIQFVSVQLSLLLFLFELLHVQVAQDMVWVWGENGPDAALESALTPAQLIPELDDKEGLASGRVSPANVGQNDLAYGWDTFMVHAQFRLLLCWFPAWVYA